MEKQARQAVAEGVAHTGALTVGRESELFRTLNMHYNKASDFQVRHSARDGVCVCVTKITMVCRNIITIGEL